MAAGYPAWRVAALPVAAVVPQVTSYFFGPGARRHDPKRCVNASVEQVAWWVVLCQASLFVTTGVAVALTGGLQSPLLVTFIAPYAAAVFVVGDRRQTWLLLGATALGVGVLASLPAAWTGPTLPRSVDVILVVVSFVGVGALLDARFTYRENFNEDLRLAVNDTPQKLSQWSIGASLGYEF